MKPRALLALLFIPASLDAQAVRFTRFLPSVAFHRSAIGPDGSIYLLTGANAPGLPVTPGAVQPEYSPGACLAFGFGGSGAQQFPCPDLYLARYSADGSRLLAATYLGGTGPESPHDLAVARDGSFLVSATSFSNNFPGLAGPVAVRSSLVARLSANLDKVHSLSLFPDRVTPTAVVESPEGGVLAAGTMATGGPSSDPVLFSVEPDAASPRLLARLASSFEILSSATAVSVGPGGDIWIAGAGANPQARAGVFVARLSPDGATRRFLTFLDFDSSPVEAAAALVVDSRGNSWVGGRAATGYFAGFSPEGIASDPVPIGFSVRSLALGPSGDLLIAGAATVGLPTTPGALARCRAGSVDGFFARWDIGSRAFSNVSYFGGSGHDEIQRIALHDGAIVLLGSAANRDIPGLPEPDQAARGGTFVTYLDAAAPEPVPSLCIDPVIVNLAESARLSRDPLDSFEAVVAPGEFVLLSGAGLGPADPAESDPVRDGSAPRELAGTVVRFDELEAPLLEAGENRVIAVVPFGVAARAATQVVVERGGLASSPVEFRVEPAFPAIFNPARLPFSDGGVFNPDWSPNAPSNPMAPGDVFTVFVSGLGKTTPDTDESLVVTSEDLPLAEQRIQAFVSGCCYIPVEFAGASRGQLPSLLQVNARLNADFIFHGRMTLELFIGKRRATAIFWVR